MSSMSGASGISGADDVPETGGRGDTIRLVLADDHPVVRAGVRAMLESEPDLEVVDEVDTADAAVRRASQGGIDVVLMDLQFPTRMQGAEATRHIRSALDAPRVLVLTNYDTDADILGAIEAGASGYLLKDAPPAELVEAIRTAAGGEPAFAPGVSSRLEANSGLERLTGREVEVLQLVAGGNSNRDIGKALFLSEATVKSHLVHIFAKLEVGSRTAAVARARDLGVIRSD
ncbi:response regulator [Agromyces sp. Marseille-Q5079]|uniref:response regulator n=1 Tax=Agromyces sp. Marseille-Q5079 TaxID=3439059 RepID=UPI003D9CAE0D